MSLTHPTRRQFLRNTALAGAALTVPELVQNAHAGVANTSYFDLTQASTNFFRDVHLQATDHPMQSFAWNPSDWLYILQTRDNAAGDMTLTRLEPDQTQNSYMILSGAGHGVAMGVDGTSSPAYYWTESEAVDDGSGSAHGRKLQRFHFTAGATITHSDCEVFDPTIHLEGTTQYQLSCSIDPTYHRIAIRYAKTAAGGTYYYNVYNLADFNNHNYIPLYSTSIKQPAKPSGAGTPQGWCLYGSWLYMSWGTYESTCPGTVASAQTGGSMVGRLNLNSPSAWVGYDSQIGYTLCDREPEGVGVRVINGVPQLHFGISGNDTGSGHYASMYYKTAMI